MFMKVAPGVEGSDVAGVVEQVGEKAKALGFKVGDRYCFFFLIFYYIFFVLTFLLEWQLCCFMADSQNIR